MLDLVAEAFQRVLFGGLGVAGGGAHAEGEWIDLNSLIRQSQRAAVLITRLSAGEP